MDQQTPDPADRAPATAVGVLGLAIELVAPVAAGVGIAMVVLWKVVLPSIGLGGDVQRIVELASHLSEGYPGPTAVFLGNSLTVEGVDAGIVAAAAEEAGRGPWAAENLGINGCDITETRVLVDRVLAAQPRAVVLTLRAVDLGSAPDVPPDKAYAYGWAGFVDAWPSGKRFEDLPGLTAESAAGMSASRLAALVHFRTAPLNVFEGWLRVKTAGTVRRVSPSNWTAPFNRRGSINEKQLAKHAAQVTGIFEVRMGGERMGAGEIEAVATQIAEAEAAPVLVMAPIHPVLRELNAPYRAELAGLLGRVARERGGVFLDLTELAGAELFSDATHLNEDGRALYSRAIGSSLPVVSGGGG